MKMKKVYLVDIDGTICDDIRNEEGIAAMAIAKPYLDGIEWVNKKYDEGHYICFFTARKQEHKEVTEDWLDNHDVKYHQVIYNKPRRIGKYTSYHMIDNASVKATTYKGKFSEMVKKQVEIEVFED